MPEQSTTPTRDAFTLLSKPTLELTDEEVELICKDLRQRRERFLAGQKDNYPKPPKKEVQPITAESKAANTEGLLGSLGDLKL